MKKNMGLADRNIRILLAMSIAVLYFLNLIIGIFAVVLLLIILVLLVTSSFRVCPVYLPFGITTKKKSE